MTTRYLDGDDSILIWAEAYVAEGETLVSQVNSEEPTAKGDMRLLMDAERTELAAVKAVINRLQERVKVISMTPEFLEIWRRWMHREMDLELNLAEGKAGQQKAAADYLAAMQNICAFFTNKSPSSVLVIEDGPESNMARAYVAEAEAQVALIKAGESGEKAKEVKEARRKELAAAGAVLRKIEAGMPAVNLTPEYVGMWERWIMRVARLDMQLTEEDDARQKIGEKWVEKANGFFRILDGRKELDVDRISLSIGEAGVEEAKVMLEKAKSGMNVDVQVE